MKEVKISEVKAKLAAGMSRKDIDKELELNPKESAMLWKHPKLVGIKKSKYKTEVNLVDDTEQS